MSIVTAEPQTEHVATMASRELDENNPFHIPRLSLAREILIVSTVCSAQALVQAGLAQGLLPDNVIAKAFGVGEANATWGPAGQYLDLLFSQSKADIWS